MKGGGSERTRSKWMEICQVMRKSKIDILAVQEMHMSKEMEDEVNEIFSRHIKVVSNIDNE